MCYIHNRNYLQTGDPMFSRKKLFEQKRIIDKKMVQEWKIRNKESRKEITKLLRQIYFRKIHFFAINDEDRDRFTQNDFLIDQLYFKADKLIGEILKNS